MLCARVVGAGLVPARVNVRPGASFDVPSGFGMRVNKVRGVGGWGGFKQIHALSQEVAQRRTGANIHPGRHKTGPYNTGFVHP